MKMKLADLTNKVEEFHFLNSANIIILNAIGYMDRNNILVEADENDRMRIAINLIHEVIKNKYSDMQPAAATKTGKVFESVRESIDSESCFLINQ
ncbi:hypothetical protein [Adlercreutzia sp. ZJ154]|uniref:hypothetical protein n=1 Tax=Adlercreutzia sp. ZJ154 TaxID=2709790 RepID=UPI0013EA66BA|nr:hypothetical protein [Adlercreutzia sp. ZJ154]